MYSNLAYKCTYNKPLVYSSCVSTYPGGSSETSPLIYGSCRSCTFHIAIRDDGSVLLGENHFIRNNQRKKMQNYGIAISFNSIILGICSFSHFISKNQCQESAAFIHNFCSFACSSKHVHVITSWIFLTL